MRLLAISIFYITLSSLLTTANADTGEPNLEKGTYWKSFETPIAGYPSEKSIVHDYFDYKKNGTVLTFNQFTNFYNTHRCYVSGEAIKIDASSFQMSYEDDYGKLCLFEIEFDDEGVLTKLIVGNRDCMDCTSGGSIYETRFQSDSLNKSPHSNLSDLDICLHIIKKIEKDGTITTYDGTSPDMLLEFKNRNLSSPTCSKLILHSRLN